MQVEAIEAKVSPLGQRPYRKGHSSAGWMRTSCSKGFWRIFAYIALAMCENMRVRSKLFCIGYWLSFAFSFAISEIMLRSCIVHGNWLSSGTIFIVV